MRHSSLVDLLRFQSERLSSEIAYTVLEDGVDEGPSLTYERLSQQARAIGARLQQIIPRGERAILLYPRGLEYTAAFFGCLYAGVVPIPAFPPRINRKNERLTAIIDDAGAMLALTVSAAKKKTQAYLSSTYGKAAIPVESTDDVVEGLATELTEFSPGPDDLAYLQYTSGSTASPKGVMISHRNVLSNLAYINDGFEHGSESVSLTWLPHFHDMGLVDGLLMPLYRGFRGLLMTPAQFLQRPILWLEAITRYGVTHSGGPNFAYDLCVRKTTDEQRAGLNLQSWTVAYNGAEPIRREVLERFAEEFAPFGFRSSAFYPAYGLAEATLKVSGGRKGDPPVYCAIVNDALEQKKVIVASDDAKDARHVVSCGGVASGTVVAIVDPESEAECDPDTIGEIWVSGPGVAKGFWNRPEESERVFRAFTTDTHKGPYLRTGDLGFLRENELYVTGRLKDLIIIRGRNIYPQDLEATAGRSHRSLRPGGGAAFSISEGGEECVVLVHELETRRTKDIDEIIAAIRQAFSETHELQLRSIALIKPGSLPRTSSGKAQRQVCRRMFQAHELDIVGEWSLDESKSESAEDSLAGAMEFCFDEVHDVSLLLRQVIADKLAIPAAAISLDEPLSRLGLDSLASIEVAHTIEARLMLTIPMADLLADRSIKELAAESILTAARAGVSVTGSLSEKGPSAEFALSRGQQAIWFIHKMDPLNTAYNMTGAVSITSDLNTNSLRRAFQMLVDRHESLRTTFREVNGVAYQHAISGAEVCFNLVDASEWSDQFLNSRVEEEAGRPFDLENGPVFRVTLYRRAADRYVLLIAVHHIVADFWSLSLLIHELGKLYRNNEAATPDDLPNRIASYDGYVTSQDRMLRSGAGEDHWKYWSRQLDGNLPLTLPLDRERPRVQTYRGDRVSFSICSEQVEKTKSLSTAGQTTLFVTLLAVFQTLLCKYAGQEEILIGTPTSGRLSPDLARVVGYFVNPVVIRSFIHAGDSFFDTVAKTRQTVIEAFRHQEYPFADIVKRLNAGGDTSRSPLFQAMFALQKSSLDPTGGLGAISLGDLRASLQVGQLELRGFPVQQRSSQFDITLAVAEYGNEVKASLEYNTDLFDGATIERMAAHFLVLLERFVSNPFAPVSSVSYITAAERHQLLGEWGDNSRDSSEIISIHREFERQVSSIPDSVAIVDRDSNLTYRELDVRANKLCGYLRSAGVSHETAVLLMAHRSAETVIALIAVLKSGGAYVPIDPSTPLSRVNAIVQDVRPSAVLAHSDLANKVRDQGVEPFYLDRDWARLDLEPDSGVAVDVDRDAICYVIYTSGSTGMPKGVAIRHFSLTQYIHAARSDYVITREERVLQFASLSFDASGEEIYGPLTSGATLIIHSDSAAVSISALVEFCRERMITLLSLPTAYWHAMVSSLSATEWRSAISVKQVVIGGEGALPAKMDEWVNIAGDRVRLINSYGPSETTIGVTSWSPPRRSSGSQSRVLIGRPIAGSLIRVLDIHGQPSASGVAGEINAGGAGLARGYVNDPAKTAASFVPDAFGEHAGARVYRSGDLGRFVADGNLECLGRMDRQVKVRGYRIELQEVEGALSHLPGVAEAAVTAIDDGRGNKRLAAYVVLQEGFNCNADLMRDSLREILPHFMAPHHFVFLKELPRNASGKVDVRSLPPVQLEPQLLRNAEGGLRPGVEQQIAEIWKQLLGVPGIGPDDNFFELGGDSILSLQAAAMARECGIVITPKQIFENLTVRRLAEAASNAPADRARQISIKGPAPLTPIQRWFFECNFEDKHHWNMAVLLQVREKLSIEVISNSLSSLIDQHRALRSTFTDESGQWRQRFDSGRPPATREVDLTGLSMREESAAIGSAIAFEQAGLDLNNGPLLRLVLFKNSPGKKDRLLIVAHHLIVDAISLRILIEDLDRFCAHLIDGSGNQRPERPATAEAGLWAAELERLGAADNLQAELAHWSRHDYANAAVLPADFAGANLEASAVTFETRLDRVRTEDLIRTAPEAYRAKVDELLLAALAETLCDWTGAEAALIELERHGREANAIDLDLSRSIGWFTSTFPLLIQAGSRSNRLDAVKAVKESLRSLPNGGLGFGILRYLSGDAKLNDEMRKAPEPRVSFNNLGDLDASFGRFRFFESPEILVAGSRSSKAVRPSLLEVDAGIKDQSLEIHWRFSTDIFKPETIERLANSFTDRLVSLIERGVSGEAVSYSTSDFPLAKLSQDRLDQLTRSDPMIRDIYPLSPSQQGMLFHAVYSAEEDVYAGTLLLSITGNLEMGPFEKTWEQIVRRHSIFRTSFAWEEMAEPVQIVHANTSLPVRLLDWSDVPEQTALDRLKELAAEERLRGFDLSAAPLMRITLIRLSDERLLMAVTLHHLLVDGWSISLLFGEMLTGYEAIVRDTGVKDTGVLEPDRARSFESYIGWLRRQDRGAAETFWREELRGVSSPPILPIYRAGSSPAGEMTSRRRIRLSQSLTSSLVSFARQNRLTLNTVVQGAWAVLLARYCSTADVLFGVVTAGRPPSLPESEKIIGPFSVTLPARARPSSNQPLGIWLPALQDRQIEARRFDYCSLIDIQGWSEVSRGRPLFDSIIAFENYPLDKESLASSSSLKLELIESLESTNYPLTLIVFPGDHLSIELVYRSDQVEESAVDRLLRHFEVLLTGFPDHASHAVSTIPMLTGEEYRQILGEWRGHATAYPGDKTIAALFREQVDRAPDSVGAVFADRQVSYAELYRRAGTVATFLSGRGVCPETIVGISTERSIEMIVGILGILRSGAAYLPVDLSYPEERIRFTLADSGAALVLTVRPVEIAPEDGSFKFLSVDSILDQSFAYTNAAEATDSPVVGDVLGERFGDPENLAYIIYTSGSTGSPKGVGITNRGVVRLVRETNYFDFSADEVFLQSSTLAFDASTFEIWGALLNGARLVIMPPETPAPAQISAALKDHQITAAWFTAGLFHLLVQDCVEDFSGVKHVLAGGDVVAIEDARALSINAPRCSLINGYGPTESTTFAACYRDAVYDRALLPIGRPISNTFIYILDEDLNPVPEGISGELYIGGDGLARCYVGATELTAERFLPDPFGIDGARVYRSGDIGRFLPDGNIEFLGRRDRQVKLRGFRIELGEIESTLAAHPRVRQCAVIASDERFGDKRLVAYLSPAAGTELSADEAREFLRARLPAYMIPAAFVFLDTLPLTPNGKIDRANLPAPEGAPPAVTGYVAPGNAVEEVLASIWEENLVLDKVGVRDDFFELGGHSLIAMRVISAIRYIFKVDLSVSKIFESPTIGGLARELQAVETKSGQMERIAAVVQRIKNMSPEERAEKLQTKSRRSV